MKLLTLCRSFSPIFIPFATIIRLAIILVPMHASAKTTTWTGNAPSSLWSDSGNWDNGVPELLDDVQFDTVGGTSEQDIFGLLLGSMDMTSFTGNLILQNELGVAGDVTVDGTLDIATQTLHVDGSLMVNGNLSGDFSQVVVGVDVTSSGTISMINGKLDVMGSISLPAGTLNALGGTIEFGKDVDFALGATVVWGGSGTLRFDGSGTGSWSDQSTQRDYGVVDVNGIGGRLVVPSANLPFSVAELMVTAGTLELRSDFTVVGDAWVGASAALEVSSAATDPTLTFHGMFEVNGVFDMNSVGGTIRFEGGPSGVVTAADFSVFSVVGWPGSLIAVEQDGLVGGEYWLFNHQTLAALTFDYVEVQDSDASSGVLPVSATRSMDAGNNLNWVFTVSAVDDTPVIGAALQAAPNPFNPGTTIWYVLTRSGPLSIRIYDVRGRVVRSLVEDMSHVAGSFSVKWDGRTDDGVQGRSGVYFCRARTTDETTALKLLLVK